MSDGNDSDSSDGFSDRKSQNRKKRIKKKSTKSKTPQEKFVLVSAIKEDHKKAIYSVTFNPFLHPNTNPVFATVGGRQLTIYQCNIHGEPGGTTVLQTFQDPDETEVFYTSAWGILGDNPIIAFAGEHGSIRILSIINTQIVRHLIGHGSSINELHFHPIQRRLLASASKDHTIRVWDVWSEVIVFILGGLHGHRDEVLSCDFQPTGNQIASCGMDHSILIWDISTERAKLAIKAASVFKLNNSDTPFPTVTLAPIFSTRDIHSNYIDCIRWYGEFILSKSCENEIKCWEPDLSKPNEFPSPPIKALVSFEVNNCPNWYVRFGTDRYQKFMAVGNQVGKIFVWDFSSGYSNKPHHTLTHMKMLAQCRQCSFSPNGEIIIAVFDDATVWRFDYRNYGRKKEKILEKVEVNGFSKKEEVPDTVTHNLIPEPGDSKIKDEPKKEPEEIVPESTINIDNSKKSELDEPTGEANGPEIGPVPMDTLEPMEVECPEEDTLKPVESDL